MRNQVFARRCTAEAGSLRALRHEVDAWLAVMDWPEAQREDVVLAVSEVGANAVDHAYPTQVVGEVAVFARVCGNGQMRYVDLLVRDWGRWRPPPADPGHRGHGLIVVRECMDTTAIYRGGFTGTAVAMTSYPVPDTTSPNARRAAWPALPHPTLDGELIAELPVDPAVSNSRQRHAAILQASGQLCASSTRHGADATSAWQRAQATMSTSARVTAEARHLRAAQRRRKVAA